MQQTQDQAKRVTHLLHLSSSVSTRLFRKMIASSNSSFSAEALRCHETFFSDQDMHDVQEETGSPQTPPNPSSPEPLRTHGKDELPDDVGELHNLLSRERRDREKRQRIFVRRTEAVRWMVRASSHHGFSTLTSVLAIDYFDRFVARTLFPQDVAWAVQLAAVACLSLAAKVEETRVPLLLDLQEVAETELVFEAGTVQRMELLILSQLEWRMNPVTPLSFLHHFLNTCQQLKTHTHLHSEFVSKFEDLILWVVSDSRFMCYLPSTLAMAAVLHISDGIEYRKRLMSVLNFSDEVISFKILDECYELVQEVSFHHHRRNGNDGETYLASIRHDDQPGRQINVRVLEAKEETSSHNTDFCSSDLSSWTAAQVKI